MLNLPSTVTQPLKSSSQLDGQAEVNLFSPESGRTEAKEGTDGSSSQIIQTADPNTQNSAQIRELTNQEQLQTISLLVLNFCQYLTQPKWKRSRVTTIVPVLNFCQCLTQPMLKRSRLTIILQVLIICQFLTQLKWKRSRQVLNLCQFVTKQIYKHLTFFRCSFS